MKYQGSDYDILDNETVLDVLLRNKLKVRYSCRTGICQSCILQMVKGNINPAAQKGLKAPAVALNQFLACKQAAITIDDVVDIDQNSLFSPAKVLTKVLYATDILCLKLEPLNPHNFRAGQFINVRNSQGDIRSYSIASLPTMEPFLELHIQKIANGKLSNWIFNTIDSGDIIEFQGPLGDCFYVPDKTETDNKLMLIGTGTGAAPLMGIAKDALHSNHRGEIHFYHGVREFESLYLHRQLSSLEKQHANFYYHPCVSNEQNPYCSNINSGRASDIALKNISNPNQTQLYLCGNPNMVTSTQKLAFLSGVPLKNIHTDPFVY